MLSVTSFCGFSQGQIIEKIIAKVDDQIILLSELEMATLEFKRSQQVQVDQLECKVLETLVINKLLLAKAAIDSVTVSKKEIDQQLDQRMRQILRMYGGNEETLVQEYGKSSKQLKKELRPKLADQLLIQKMESKITANVKVTPKEVEEFYAEIPKDSLPFFSTELELAQIVLFPKPGNKEKQDVIDQLKSFKDRIVKGTSTFEELAKIYSIDVSSARQGGDLGYQGQGQLVPEYEATALRLKTGQISEPVESQFGYHLIQMIDRRGKEYRTRHILMKPKPNPDGISKVRSTLDSLKLQIEIDSISFFKAAYTYSEDEKTKATGGRITDYEGNSRVAANQTEIIGPNLFFLADKMNPGEVSEPVPYEAPDGQNGLRLVHMISKVKAHEANLRDDYQKIYNATMANKKNQAVNDWFAKTRSEVFIDIDPDYEYCNIEITQ